MYYVYSELFKKKASAIITYTATKVQNQFTFLIQVLNHEDKKFDC